MKALLDIVEQHKSGKENGIYSVCSSHPLVLEASIRHALRTGETLVIESTSNQVNQDGGYTGMQPQQFRELVESIASKVGLDLDRIILGGDHLGPNCWQHLNADDAMEKSDILIEQYVAAGFRKIHLDCSMSCADDPTPLGDKLVAQRAARLCSVAERTWKTHGGEPPVYIVGTEVPVPGGAHEELAELAVTSVESATETLEIHQQAFQSEGLEDAWNRVIGLVVQPGVEFDNHKVIDFVPAAAATLSDLSESIPGLVYEAHSTDYQSTENLSALVKGHFAILKVGPGLTYAMREAFWALSDIEAEWVDEPKRSNLKTEILGEMHKNPGYWQKYYAEDEKQRSLDCQYSLSDRIRYYWLTPKVEAALETLLTNLEHDFPPMTLLSQYMPAQYQALRSGEIKASVRELVFHKISETLNQYSHACRAAG